MDKEIKEGLIKAIVEKGIHVLGKDGDYIIDVNEDEARKMFTLAEINIKEINKKNKNERCEKLTFEVSAWIDAGPNETLSRLRKFYNSIISIQLGGEGVMGGHHSLMNKRASYQEIKEFWRHYKLNYPTKQEN